MVMCSISQSANKIRKFSNCICLRGRRSRVVECRDSLYNTSVNCEDKDGNKIVKSFYISYGLGPLDGEIMIADQDQTVIRYGV